MTALSDSTSPAIVQTGRAFTSRRASVYLLGVWFAGLLLTWGIVENPFYDFASTLHFADRWANGQAPYVDFQHVYPPLAVWLYGLVMRCCQNCYAAVAGLSSISALLFLAANYRLARLLFGRRNSLLISTSTFVATNIIVSLSGVNFIIAGGVYTGLTLFNWFAWTAAMGLRERRHQFVYCGVAGLLAGLSALIKTERVAGVLAVFCFLIIYHLLARRLRGMLAMLVLVAVSGLVAAAGYWLAALESGTEALKSGLTGYGAAGDFASQNMPTLVHMLFQLGILALHAAVFLFLVAQFRRKERERPLRMGLFFLLAGAAAVCLEGLRAATLLSSVDMRTATSVSQTVATLKLISPEGGSLLAIVNYIGGKLLSNIMPTLFFLVCAAMFLLGRLVKIRRSRWPVIPYRFACLGLMVLAACGIQARWLLLRTDYGVLSLALPALFYMVPCLFVARTAGSKHSMARVLRQGYIRIWLIGLLIAMTALYMYEFRAARFRPVVMETDKGKILLPDTAMNRSFKELGAFLQTRDLDNKQVIFLPYCGPQYWIGGKMPVYAGTPILSSWYKPPFSTRLEEEIVEGSVIIVEFARLERYVQGVMTDGNFSWIDGTKLCVENWKETAAPIWQYMQEDMKETATLGPEGDPFFRVWEALEDATP